MRYPSLFTMPFVLLCLSGLMFFISFNMIVAELPNYLTSLGGEQYKGLIISLFTVTAGLSRPFSGKLADSIGRIPVMVIGAMVCVVCGFIYPVANSVFAFLTLRLFHGFSTGFKPTGTAAYVADLVPATRRGEAMGLLGFFNSMGIAAGPIMGSWIAAEYSLDAMFYLSSLFSFLSVFILLNMKETVSEKKSFSPDLLKISFADVFTPEVLPAAKVMATLTFTFGAVLTIIPDFSDYLQVGNKGYFFAAFTAASLIVRVFFGRVSDLYGRVPVLFFALLCQAATLIFLGFTNSETMFLILAGCLGICVGFHAPAVFAWTIDLSNKKHVGRAVATSYIALEIGIGSGAFLSAMVYANHAENFKYAFWLCALVALIGFIYISSYMIRRRSFR